MMYFGEIISLCVAALWTVSALSSEIASKRMGVLVLNFWRMVLALLFSVVLMWVATGKPLPLEAGWQAWAWLLGSGLVGYFLGDWCLFNSYVVMGSRFGQLFMTLAPAFTAFFAWTMIGQTLSWHSLLAMVVTLAGIAVAVSDKSGTEDGQPLPRRGILYGLGAALGQGFGLVMSKIGIDYYTSALPAERLADISNYVPFGSNLIRCIAGLVCTWLWLMAMREWGKKRSVRSVGLSTDHPLAERPRPSLMSSLRDRRAVLAMLITVLSGPFVGVGLSLMAVQHTAAGIASTLMATTPILILLPSRWLFHQPVTMRSVLGAAISCVGVSLFFLL